MFETYELGLKFGDVASASVALGMHLRWLFLEGEKLSSLQGKYDVYIKQMAKYNKEAAKLAILDQLNVNLLMGVSCESFSIFE